MELQTQSQLRAVQRLPFCCICGNPFGSGEKRTRQHTPPKSIFAVEDRTPPLILPAHEECNGDQSPLDTVIGQLVALLHGKYPARKDLMLEVDVLPVGETGITAGVKHLPLRRILFRWVRCFHAALYGEYLVDRGGMIFEPFPAGGVVDGELVYDKIHMNRPMLTHLFKQQVAAGCTDAVICYNNRCQYRCSWLTFDDGRSFCLFAMRLYNWEDLGDPNHPNMGCIGWYWADTPAVAALGTSLEVAVSNCSPFDPFGK